MNIGEIAETFIRAAEIERATPGHVGPAHASGTTSDAIDAFFTQTLGAMLDANLITGKVNLYVSPTIETVVGYRKARQKRRLAPLEDA